MPPITDAAERPDHDDRSDAELVEAANAGDAGAFETLYRRYRDWVVSLALRFTGDRELALDVLQDAFVYVLGKFPGFELRAKMTTFLYPVVRNLAVSAASRGRRERAVSDVPRTPAAARFAAGDDERLRGLAEAVGELPAGQREVVMLRFGDGLALAEIAEVLAIPVGTVKSRLHQALETLRADLRAKSFLEE